MLPDANYVLCAPARKVANPEYLGYWDKFFTIVRDDDLVDELFPYQRYFGDGFMAYRSPEGEVEPWTRAAARAQVSWARERRPALLSISPEDDAFGREQLRAMGVPEDAWYVGLHVREGGFYGEFAGSMSEHRNASVEDYRDAVREITRRGGWVIRLGDRSMRPLEPLPQVVDYARSEFKSRRMDVFLLATSRFVVGTTSGLTTAALSFGTPAVLVNCISNDWQLWSGDTDFIVKRLYDRREKRFLSLGETYRQPVQGYLINNVVTRRQGYDIHPNTAAEITEAVRYKLDIVLGDRPRPGEPSAALQRYRQAMAGNPLMFGAAHPVVPFLERHPELTACELAELAA
jgi:putative glycosyltransferase (TIGR04372 family)